MPNRLLESSVLPQFFPAHWLESAPDMVFSEFPSRIRIGYVVRGEGGYWYVMRQHLEESGLALQALHNAAVLNLQDLPTPSWYVASTPGGPEAWLSDTVDNFNAARLLLPSLQQALAAELGEPFLAAIPCRDWHICWSFAQDAEWQSKNIAEAAKIYREDDYNLTPDVLSFSKGNVTLHLAQ